ncbi:hypothetical protein Droror1_Dr00019733 [Drosera rotundifolia]
MSRQGSQIASLKDLEIYNHVEAMPVDSAQRDVNWKSGMDQVGVKSEPYTDVLKGTVGSKTEVAVMTRSHNMRNSIQLSNVGHKDEEIRISLDKVDPEREYWET